MAGITTKPDSNIIEIKHIEKAFSGKCVLKDIDFSVKKGEFITLLGPSGCGKTTLLRIIAGFEGATKGEVLMNGESILTIPPYKRPMNTVFQRYALFPHLNVMENVSFGLKLKNIDSETIKQKVKKALKMVGLMDYEERDVVSLSGGQQQRVAIARAIINSPQVLLLDEPLAALDLKMRHDMQIELKKLHKTLGITFIYVTHDQEEALTLSDRVVVMNDGIIQQIGTPTDIYNEPKNEFVADFIGESNLINGEMVKDELVRFMGKEFKCVDKGFEEMCPVEVVIRPEDIYIMPRNDNGMFHGRVTSCIFKGIHYEMRVETPDGYEILVQDYNPFEVGMDVSMIVKPNDLHVMKRQWLDNQLDATIIDSTHISMLGGTFTTLPHSFEKGSSVKIKVDFDKVSLTDYAEEGTISGSVRFILYVGNHYHVGVKTKNDEFIFLDTLDEWDEGDIVGVNIQPEDFHIVSGE